MKSIIKENQYFLIPYFVFLLAGGVLLLMEEKGNLHLSFIRFHHPAADLFFKYLTYLGDGIIVCVVIFIYLFIRIRNSIILLTGYLISSITTQILKHTFFDKEPRPAKFFENLGEKIREIPGVTLHHWNSFPSGHAAAAFTLFFCLGLFTRNKALKFFLFIVSLFAAYSRVYLSQHFFSDIYAGSVLGVASSLGVWYYFEKTGKFRHPRFERGIFQSK